MRLLNAVRSGIQSFFRVTFRKMTLAFLVPGMVLLVVGLSLGSVGAILAYLGAVVMATGYVICLRRPRSFVILVLANLIAFPVGVVLHNAFYAFNEMWGHISGLHWIFEFLHVVFFVVAVVFSPVGILTGIIGLIVTWFRTNTLRKQGV